MDWDKLRIFFAVAEAGSFTRAGENLNLSQSAVSRQISGLEESLGISLFHRHARGLILTEQGETLFRTTQDVFNKLTKVEAQITDTKKSGEGPIVVTVSEFIGTTWLVPKLAALRRAHPDIKITILFDDRVLNLSTREADVAIRLLKPQQGDLIQERITDITFHVCASKAYLEEYGVPQKLSDLKDHMLIGFSEHVVSPFNDPNWIWKQARIPVSAPRLMILNSMNAIIRAAESGAGIASLPDYFIHKNPDLKTILPDLKRENVELYFAYPEERRHSKRIEKLHNFLFENIDT